MLAFLLSLICFSGVQGPQAQQDLTDQIYHNARSDSTKSDVVIIDNIFIIGNKKTKNKIILREMDITKGQTISAAELQEILEADRKKIFNTRLFNDVQLSVLKLSDTKVDVVVKVSERWYTFPAPIFTLVDRNFNDWWQNQNRDFSRVNYGVKLFKNNFRGRNETIKLTLQLGFTRNIGLEYKIPYIDKAQKHGISFETSYSENKNIAVRTVDHVPQFFDSENILRIRRKYGIGYRFRKSFYTTHFFDLEYNHNTINDTVAVLNPRYYLAGRTSQRYFLAFYTFTMDKRDIVSYPLSGYRWDFRATKFGLGIFDDLDKFQLNLSYARFIDLNKGFYLSNYSSAQMSFPERQPYANFSALGFNKDFIRGYELFLIEGQNYYLNRTSFKKRLLSTKKRVGLIPVDQFREVPLDIYLKTYLDMGYAENYEEHIENRALSDTFIFGAGIGLDFVTYYDSVIRTEFTTNREGNTGFFLHFKKDF